MTHRKGPWTVDSLREHPLFPDALRRAVYDALQATWYGEYHPDLQEFCRKCVTEAIQFQVGRGVR